MDITNLFYKNMIIGELEESYLQGYAVMIQKTLFGPPMDNNEVLTIFKENELNSIQSLLNVYTQVQNINFHWEPSDYDSNTTNLFKEDPWLREYYFDHGYSWSVLKELISGYLFVPPIEELLGRSNNQKTGYYVMTKRMGLNPNTFLPLDYHNQFTALLKIEENEIKDRVWLIDLEAEELYDMNITVEQYLNLAYQAKIFNGWQHVYLFKDQSEYYELMKRFLPKILPHINLNLKEFGIE